MSTRDGNLKAILAYTVVPLCFLAVSGVLAAQFLPACAALPVIGWHFPSGCPSTAAVEVDREIGEAQGRTRALEAEYRSLQTALLSQGDCPLPPAEPDTPGAPEAAPDPDVMDRAAWESGDIAAMEGCWQLDSHYQIQHEQTGEISVAEDWRVCFDAGGQGEQAVDFSDGMRCSSAVAADFDDSALTLTDPGNMQCNRNFFIYRRVTRCTLDRNARAICQSEQPDWRPGVTHDVRLRRADSESLTHE